MEFVRKYKNAFIVVGAVAAIAVVGKIANDRYGWMSPKELPGVVNPVKAAVAAAPRGKLPWAVGDVGLWDDENPNYCEGCQSLCDQSYGGKNSTQCEMCQDTCGNRN